jgi:hypothetical protein
MEVTRSSEMFMGLSTLVPEDRTHILPGALLAFAYE